jgi:hypothetical protein
MNKGSCINPDEALVVLGSLNAKPQDRTFDRSALHPVQVITASGIYPVRFLDAWGALGVSALAWVDAHTGYLTTGDDLWEMRIPDGEMTHREIPNLRDVHELTVINGVLWLANTGLDQALGFDLATRTVQQVIDLKGWRASVQQEGLPDYVRKEEAQWVDRFHCNQVFEGHEGHLYALVHHVNGWQLIHKVAEKLIKTHGNGGVLNLTTGTVIPLNLKAPHTVRRVGPHYWLFDSGANMLHVYDTAWRLRSRMPTRGWGRGGQVSQNGRWFYGGISATRKRYLGVIQGAQQTDNIIQIFDIQTGESVQELRVPNIEQINNVCVMPLECAEALLTVGEPVDETSPRTGG